MVEIEYTDGFETSYKMRASRHVRKLFRQRLKVFKKNPHDKSLRNHPLQYDLKGFRSWSLTNEKGKDDYRVLFRIMKDGKYTFVDFGTHDQLYRSWKMTAYWM